MKIVIDTNVVISGTFFGTVQQKLSKLRKLLGGYFFLLS